QLEDLIQSLSRSRDENVLVDIEAAIRVALQQSAITGSAEPMVAALRQSDERLARLEQPRFEPVRRALARDLDKVRAVGIADLSTLTIKLDEAARMVDELPLLSAAESHRGPGGAVSAASVAAAPASQAKPPAAAASASAWPAWMLGWSDTWAAATERVWDEARSLVRVTHIEHPEGMLMSPDQGFFLRENLKLRLLNARLALLSRQYDTVQSDLRSANAAVDRYFDRRSRKTMLASELIQQVAGQARAVNLPRPDDTLAALAASTAVR
ncbi:MAG: hypothetical protein JWP52_757, partial [Rhizobacter sp.]|nr:hypothetical protein [Rhizobacter sp.]